MLCMIKFYEPTEPSDEQDRRGCEVTDLGVSWAFMFMMMSIDCAMYWTIYVKGTFFRFWRSLSSCTSSFSISFN